MKKLIIISLFLFWTGLVVIVSIGMFSKPVSVAPQKGGLTDNLTGNNGGTSVVLSLEEVAKHNSVSDCWMIANGKVYNVTAYLPYHPGGAFAISPYCGKDGGPAFQAQGHSSNASSLLSQYYIGDLNQQVQTGTINNASTVTPPAGSGGGENEHEGENEWEDD